MTSDQTIRRLITGLLIVAGAYFTIRLFGDIRAVYASILFKPDSGLTVPLDSCQVEDYRAGPESQLGALSIPSCSVTQPFLFGPMLKFPVKLDPENVDLQQGEVWIDLASLGLGKWINLAGGRVRMVVVIPNSMSSSDDNARRAGGSIMLESEDVQGHRQKLFGPWKDFSNALAPEVFEFTVSPDNSGSHRDPGFLGTEGRIRRIGLKLARNAAESRVREGNVTLVNASIFLADPETNRRALGRGRELRQAPPDRQTLDLVGPVPNTAGRPLSGHFVPLRNVQSVASVPEPGQPDTPVQSAEILFPTYEASAQGRSARLSYEMARPFNGFGRALSASVAVGPRLRGFQPRPHLVQFELEDGSGKIVRGPSTDLSSGIALDAFEREERSLWLPVEIRHEFLSAPDGFKWNDIQHIRLRFLTGKASHEFHGPYPLRGTMLLSGITVRDLQPGPKPLKTFRPGPFVERPPVPLERFLVGVNYDWVPHFGYSIGSYNFGGRLRCGMSEPINTATLHRDFATLAGHRVKLVRVWLFADLRSGSVRTDGKLTPDRCALADLTALLNALEAHHLSGVLSLFDFKIADAVDPHKKYGSRSWTEGEFPDLVTNHRHVLIDFVKPFIQLISSRTRANPALTYAVELMNEPSYAAAVMTADKIEEFRSFLKDLQDMIWSTDPKLPVTLGSRNRRDMIELWKDLGESDRPWVYQYHFYDAIEEEEGLTLRFPAGHLGIRGPVIVGEVEPTDIQNKLDAIYRSGHDAAIFWGLNELDGYRIDLNEIDQWFAKIARERGSR